MNAKAITPAADAAKKAKLAEQARNRRAAKKAAANVAAAVNRAPAVNDPAATPTYPQAPANMVEHAVDGTVVHVSESLSLADRDKVARQLIGAKADAAKPEAAPAPAKPAKAKRDPNKKRVYLSLAQFKRIQGDASWITDNDAAWKQLRKDAVQHDQAKDGKVYHSYYSVLLDTAHAEAVEAHQAANKKAPKKA